MPPHRDTSDQRHYIQGSSAGPHPDGATPDIVLYQVPYLTIAIDCPCGVRTQCSGSWPDIVSPVACSCSRTWVVDVNVVATRAGTGPTRTNGTSTDGPSPGLS